MFTGIIEALGRVEKKQEKNGDLIVTVSSEKLDFSDVKLGDSIAVNGICLTLEDITGNQLIFYTSGETNLKISPFHVGQKVNLERSLILGSRISGHFVFGHIDGVAKLKGVTSIDKSEIWELAVPTELSKYFAPKGSVAINGVSLTINSVSKSSITINLIPFTIEHTSFKYNQVDDFLNIEVDMLARYVDSTLQNNNE